VPHSQRWSSFRSATRSSWLRAADVTARATYPYSIKLLGIPVKTGRLSSTNPNMQNVPVRTPLADVESSFNAVSADAGEAGTFFFQGRGAGRGPTASAVIADLVDVARGAFGPVFGRPARELAPAKREPAVSGGGIDDVQLLWPAAESAAALGACGDLGDHEIRTVPAGGPDAGRAGLGKDHFVVGAPAQVFDIHARGRAAGREVADHDCNALVIRAD